MEKCLCHSGLAYAACCKPYHEGALPPTATALMRSRYSAYALGLTHYIIDTSHPNLPKPNPAAIKAFSKSTTFDNLEILETHENGNRATVTFKATLFQQGYDCSFTEKSTFEKVEGKWLYLKGEMLKQ